MRQDPNSAFDPASGAVEYPPIEYNPTPPPGHSPPPMGFPPASGYPPPVFPQYPGGYPDGYHPYPTQRAGTNGKAIAALVSSLVGFSCCGFPAIFGVILGIVAMREIKQTGQEGYGMALAGVIVGALTVAFFTIGLVLIFFFDGLEDPTYY